MPARAPWFTNTPVTAQPIRSTSAGLSGRFDLGTVEPEDDDVGTVFLAFLIAASSGAIVPSG
jgi:hypothetical protein